MEPIKRTIRFACLDWKNQQQNIDIENIASLINGLSWQNQARYYNTNSGLEIAVFIDNLKYPICGQIGTTRKKELPGTETLGTRGVLNLNQATGLFEPCHFVIYKNPNSAPIIAYEYNIYAPRIGRLGEYVWAKFPNEIDYFAIEPIVSKDIDAELSKIDKVKKVAIRALSPCSFAGLNGSINKAFESLRKSFNGEIIEFIVKPDRKRSSSLRIPKNENIVRFISSDEALNFLQCFKITYTNKQTGEKEEKDLTCLLLHEDVTVKRIDLRSRAIDRQDMYDKLKQAITKNKVLLDRVRL